MNIKSIVYASLDAYKMTAMPNYINANMEHSFSKELAHEINEDVKKGLAKTNISIPLVYATKSLYTKD